MLKLRYLFEDRARALNILSSWEYDEDKIALLERFRISSNLVYPFCNRGVLHFLRFAPEGEKQESHVRAEIEFLQYLRRNGYPCHQAVFSRYGNCVEVVDIPAGRYFATAFLAVPGRSLAMQPLDSAAIYDWGKAMGRLHRLSGDYKPTQYARATHEDQLLWMADVLTGFPEEYAARQELALLAQWFATLPKSRDTYGLIHYDFETDNIMYDHEARVLHAIDFDDAIYHWYVMDIVNALASYEGDAVDGASEQFG